MNPADTCSVLIEEESGSRLSDRLASICREIQARGGSFVSVPQPYARDLAMWKAWKPGRSIGQIRAALLYELVRASQLEIRSGWTLAGEHIEGHAFGLHAPGATVEDLALHAGLSAAEAQEVYATFRRWEERVQIGQGYGESEVASPAMNAVYWGLGWIENHSIRDYPKVLQLGFAGIREEIEKRRASACLHDPEYPSQEDFWSAALKVCEAGCLLGERYAALAENLVASTDDLAEKQRLEQMAAICRRVPAQSARTLREAVQALWLAHVLTCGEDSINANSIGRLDQMLEPSYQADLAAGRITREEAVDLMIELACKLYLDYDVQAITLGGVDVQGNDASGEMTGIILEATERVDFVRDLSVRLHAHTPEWIHRECARLIARGGGIPFVFNDDCFITALSERGIPIEEARDYAPIGCIELTIPGKANPHAVSGWFNALKCLELALFSGRDPQTGEQIGPDTGFLSDHADYASFLKAYQAQVEWFANRMVYHCNRGELAHRAWGAMPCWSVLTDDCIERGRDITNRGARYLYHSVCFFGTANTADALCALKRLVFDQKRVDASELLDAMRADYAGSAYEHLRQILLSGTPKYGNDQEEVDQIAAEVSNHFIDLMDRMRSPLGGRYFVHLFSFLLNIEFGKRTGATPDGRRAGEPLAYSLSAHQGRDREGATALLHSLSRLPHHRAAGASAAIVDLDPALVAGPEGIERLAQLLKVAMEMGVGQLQFNVVTRERLEKAQEDPEHYGNLSVRVAGYSQRFRLLTKELQDHVIARTKHVR